MVRSNKLCDIEPEKKAQEGVVSRFKKLLFPEIEPDPGAQALGKRIELIFIGVSGGLIILILIVGVLQVAFFGG